MQRYFFYNVRKTCLTAKNNSNIYVRSNNID